jgi:uncharacterized protein
LYIENASKSLQEIIFMPIIKNSSYNNIPFWLFNPHLETIIPSLFRKIEGVNYQRERIDTEDGDFLDLDWVKNKHPKLLIISHGLEGNSDRHYVKALAKLFGKNGFDILAWNNRSCSGEINRAPVLYHHGTTHDLDTVIQHALQFNNYEEMYLAGISMGGAQTLKYIGEKGTELNEKIKKAAVYSAPCHLPSSAATLGLKRNSFYRKRFLKKLKEKISLKAQQYPDLLDTLQLDKTVDFESFDTHFTAKLHGFKDAFDFYSKVSADNWLENIHIPTLIVNALNDPLLGKECYPIELAEKHEKIHLEMPKRGGHSGFTLKGNEFTWAEWRFLEFLNEKKYL